MTQHYTVYCALRKKYTCRERTRSSSRQNKHCTSIFHLKRSQCLCVWVFFHVRLFSHSSLEFNEKNLSLHIFCRFYNLNMECVSLFSRIRRMLHIAKSFLAFSFSCFLCLFFGWHLNNFLLRLWSLSVLYSFWQRYGLQLSNEFFNSFRFRIGK